MTFDPSKLADIPDSERAKLTDELGAQTIRDVLDHVADLSRRAALGDDKALNRLTASCSASLAISILKHIASMAADHPEGEVHRACLKGLPGVQGVVTLAALQTCLLAYGDLKPCRDTPHASARHAKAFALQLGVAQSIAMAIWEEVRDWFRSPAVRRGLVGHSRSPHGTDIFVVPAPKR